MDLRERLQQTAAGNPAPLILDTRLQLQAFTHKSYYPSSNRTEAPKDWGRLAFLGAELIAMCTTEILLERYKTMRPTHLSRLQNMVTNNDTVAEWSEVYEFPDRILASSNQLQRIPSYPKHRAAVFEAYVGAVFYSEDLGRVQAWLRPLIVSVLEAYDERRNVEEEEEDDEESDDDDTGIRPTDRTPTRSPTRTSGSSETFLYDQQPFSHDSASTRSSGSTSMSRMPLLQPRTAASIRPTHSLATTDVHANAPGADRFPSLSNLSEYLPQHTAAPIRPPHGVTTADVHANQPGHHRFPTISQLSELPSGLKFHPQGSPTAPNLTPRSNPLPTPVSMTQTPPRPSSSYSSATSPPAGGYLALFNQLASQKHIEPVWEATATGPAHRPTFSATVKINGHTCGVGTAFSKQTAKHYAAKEALERLGWHTK